MTSPTAVRSLSGGRTAYWDGATQSVIIRNPFAVDGGTVFKPASGRAYFDNLQQQHSMEILDRQEKEVLVRLTADDVIALNNALNESLEHLEEWEFETRMGVIKAEIRMLLDKFSKIRLQ